MVQHMLVSFRRVSISPRFMALLELDESGRLLRAKSPNPEDAEDYAARIARLEEMRGPLKGAESVVSWLVRHGGYCFCEVIRSGSFDEVYERLNMDRFVGGPVGLVVRAPDDVKPYLAKPDLHWRKGYSACELATSWLSAGDIPDPVRAVLDSSNTYRGCTLELGHFEKCVNLRSKGRDSQTDLMLRVQLDDGRLAAVAVEGKVSETFGPLVSDWNDGSPGKQARLLRLCTDLGISPEAAGPLRYQLLHRTASALYEADGQGWPEALMLVHSFSTSRAGLEDFQAFATALGVSCSPNGMSASITTLGRGLRLGWVADLPS
jgi:hypothetical protein